MRIKRLLDSIGRDVDTISPDEIVYDAFYCLQAWYHSENAESIRRLR